MSNVVNKQKISKAGIIFIGMLIIGFPVFVLSYCSTLMHSFSF